MIQHYSAKLGKSSLALFHNISFAHHVARYYRSSLTKSWERLLREYLPDGNAAKVIKKRAIYGEMTSALQNAARLIEQVKSSA
jgi:hypothetical protein